MHPDIKLLVQLQAVDIRLSQLRALLAAFPQQLAAIDSRAAEARQKLATAKEALTGSVKARKTFEMDVDSWKEKARKYRDQSAAVKTNEAYKALQHEIQHAEGEVAQAEDRLLDRMVAGEEYERQVKAAEIELAAAERAAQGDRQKVAAEQAGFEKELEAKNAERQQEAAAIPAKLLEIYEHTAHRQHHHGMGIAEVIHEACSLCGARILPHIFQKLRRDTDDVYQCESCSRILYYIEPPPAPEPPGNAKSTAAAAHANHSNEE
jgi:predicted  nucleic acid-binding Zn-ribbon protein